MKKLFILSILLVSMMSGADILNVPDDYRYISLAIIASDDGDTILVQPGTYSGVIDFEGKEITLTSNFIYSANPADIHHTKLTGNYSDTSLISFDDGETSSCVLNGFTVTNSGSPTQGGAVSCDGTSPTISNIRFINNQATSGGALFANNAAPALLNCAFIANSAGEYGGAIYLETSELAMTDCDLIENSCGTTASTGRAGAVFVSQSTITCHNCNFRDNSALAHAGAVYLSYAIADFTNCQFTGNTAQGNVGAVYFYNSDHLNVINCTFYDNSGSDAGALRFYHNVALTDVPLVLNSICWNNSPSQLTFSPDDLMNEIIIAYSDLEGGEEAIVTNDNVNITWLDGNIDADPLFVSAEHDFFALQIDSPCLDAATDYFEHDSIVYLDLNEDEYYGEAPDMGAFETDSQNPPLLALFSCEPLAGDAPLLVDFNSESLGDIDQWQWDFDNDGITDSDEENPQWTYQEAGLYSVCLTVSAGSQSDQVFMIDLVEVSVPSDEDFDQITTSDNLWIYPNPFNPSTTVHYSLKKAGRIKLAVYNIKGQLINILKNEYQQAGNYQCNWQPENYNSGVFFIKLHSTDNISIQKVILLK